MGKVEKTGDRNSEVTGPCSVSLGGGGERVLDFILWTIVAIRLV
jgi:hypothetical protein